tara:strand:- start:424 stop:618 length:195 start_codon:yes stop_codon:yes gene_type:complete
MSIPETHNSLDWKHSEASNGRAEPAAEAGSLGGHMVRLEELDYNIHYTVTKNTTSSSQEGTTGQ